MQDELLKQKAVEINYKLMFIEARAKPNICSMGKVYSKAQKKDSLARSI